MMNKTNLLPAEWDDEGERICLEMEMGITPRMTRGEKDRMTDEFLERQWRHRPGRRPWTKIWEWFVGGGK